MRIRYLVVLVWLCQGLLAYGQGKLDQSSLGRRVEMAVLQAIKINPLPHPIYFKVNQARRQETSQGNVQRGTLSWDYTWFRLSPSQDTLPVFSQTQKLAYTRTQPWEESWKKIEASVVKSTLNYAHAWWKKNGAGSPALIDSVRLEWLPDAKINDADTLYYPIKRLEWSDFQGEPLLRSRYGAEIFTSMGFDLEMEVKNHQLHIKLRGKCYMVRGISWVKSSSANAYALAHEQLHFDITQRSLMYWKHLVQELPTFWDPNDWSAAIQQAYLQAFRQMNRWQKQYDLDTLHGQNTTEQARWEAQFKISPRE